MAIDKKPNLASNVNRISPKTRSLQQEQSAFMYASKSVRYNAVLLFVPGLCPVVALITWAAYVGPELARLFMTSSARTRTVSQFPE